MKIGRNDPCSCGSGKKYKKCCLNKEQEKNKDKASFSSVDSDDPGMKTVKPKKSIGNNEYSSIDKVFGELEKADFNGKIQIVTNVIKDPEFQDSDSFYELFNDLREFAANHEQREAYLTMVQKLKLEKPKIYKEYEDLLIRSLLFHAIADKRNADASSLFLQLAEVEDLDIDMFNFTLFKMAYYGDLDTLVKVMRTVWHEIKDSAEIMPWGLDELVSIGVNYELLSYISKTQNSSSTDKELYQRIEVFYKPPKKRFAEYFNLLKGSSDRKWAIDEFCYQTSKNRMPAQRGKKNISRDDFNQNLYFLSGDFMGYVLKNEDMPCTRAELACSDITKYIAERSDGKLKEEPSMLEKAMNPGKKAKNRAVVFEHILCPDAYTFDIFLGEQAGFMSNRAFRAIACYESVPSWLRFLESRGLIDSDLRKRTFDSLLPLFSAIENIIKTQSEDSSYQVSELKKAWREP